MYGLGVGKDVWKVPVGGGSWANIAGGFVTDIAVDGGYVYGLGFDHSVYKVSTGGGSWTKIAGCCVTDIAVTGGYVYGVGLHDGVWNVPVDGGSWAQIAGGTVTDIAASGDYVYGVGIGNGVYRVLGRADVVSHVLVELNTENSLANATRVAVMAAVSGVALAVFLSITRARTPKSEPLLSP